MWNVSFKNAYDGTTTYSNTVKYEPTNKAFVTVCNTDQAGTAPAVWKYGNVQYYSKKVTVLDSPDVKILGAKIKTTGTTQDLLFIAEYTNELSEGMTIEEFGVLTVRADLFDDSSMLNLLMLWEE